MATKKKTDTEAPEPVVEEEKLHPVEDQGIGPQDPYPTADKPAEPKEE